MKMIIISDRKYRYICEKLMELEERLKTTHSEKEELQTEKIIPETGNTVDPDEVYIDGYKVCELLCISGRTLQRLCKKHRIHTALVSHRRYYPLREIEKLFAHRSVAFDVELRERLIQECKRLKEQGNHKISNSHE
jgi:hypothetical protein